jgi:hypothetical protein
MDKRWKVTYRVWDNDGVIGIRTQIVTAENADEAIDRFYQICADEDGGCSVQVVSVPVWQH